MPALRRHMNERTSLEAAAFRRLLRHLDERKDVQNIELMTLAGFCRNCLADWYREAAEEEGMTMGKDEARAVIYGMSFGHGRRFHGSDARSSNVRERAARHTPEPKTPSSRPAFRSTQAARRRVHRPSVARLDRRLFAMPSFTTPGQLLAGFGLGLGQLLAAGFRLGGEARTFDCALPAAIAPALRVRG